MIRVTRVLHSANHRARNTASTEGNESEGANTFKSSMQTFEMLKYKTISVMTEYQTAFYQARGALHPFATLHPTS